MINKILDNLPVVSCQEATRLLSKAIDRRLSIKEFINLKMHLLVCDLCVHFQKQIKSLSKLFLAYRNKPNNISITAEPKLSEEAKIQIKRSLKS